MFKSERRHYCTVFDARYAPQGLALYDSLKRHSSVPFTLYVLAMDQEAAEIVCGLPGNFVVLSAWMLDKDVEGMSAARGNRSWQEYCWTCASNFMDYLFSQLDLPELTYLDADMLFFSDPETIFKEIGDKSIAIIPHRFNEQDRARLEKNGRFNVCWNTFRNTAVGRACLSKWAAQCREWCYYRNEDGKFGDQAYLDSWPTEYGDEVHIIQNIGAGLAPWNLQNDVLTPGPRINGVPVVFYHYHEYIHESRLTNYPLRQIDRDLIYAPYIQAINEAKARIESVRQLT